jgi:hypothetical protein
MLIRTQDLVFKNPDPGSWMENPDPGSGINIADPSLTLVTVVLYGTRYITVFSKVKAVIVKFFFWGGGG